MTKISTSNIEALANILKQKFDLFYAVQLPKLKIDCTRDDDRWILTKNAKIIQVQNIVHTLDGKFFIYGFELKNIHNYFDLPIPSSRLHIYCVDLLEFECPILCALDQIKCKLSKLERNENYIMEASETKNEHVFLPILSTFSD